MRGYVRSFEMLLASIIIISIHIFASTYIVAQKSLGVTERPDVESHVAGVLDYLLRKGVLYDVAETGDWERLNDYLSVFLAEYSYGYNVKVYRVDLSTGNITFITSFSYLYDPNTRAKATIYYYIPPPPQDTNTSYVLVIHVSR